MRFLVNMWAIQPITLEPAELARRALRQLDYWEDLRSRGKLVYTAPFVGRRARVAIYEAGSNEELFDLVNADPLFSILDREVIPLSSNEQLKGQYVRVLEEG